MGAAGSTQNAADKAIEQQLAKRAKQEKRKIKILLLGAGESGKTTVLKQMSLLYGNGINNPHKIKNSILVMIVSSMSELLIGSDQFVPVANKDLVEARRIVDDAYRNRVHTLKFTPELRDALVALWNDEGLRVTWEKHRYKTQAQEHLEYFMNKIDVLFTKEYEITEEDWLKNRVKTTGVVRETFDLQKATFEIWDVGGQRNERKKWIHCFASVNSLIYFTAINEYDSSLYESSDVNRMQESLDLFEETVNNDAFDESGLILFMNKSDLYAEKLNQVPIRVSGESGDSRWTDFKGPYCPVGEPRDSKLWKDCYDAGIEYFEQKFVDRNHKPTTKKLYSHVTCAMDKTNIDFVFGVCRQLILEKMLHNVGVLNL